MNCSKLAHVLEQKSSESTPAEVARMCALLMTTVEAPTELECEETFESLWQDVHLRIQAANDQYEAMTGELESLAKSDPKKFNPEQIWILIRAIKVQSQMLKMYIGEPMFEVK
ncbi:MAG: hypothetical protein R3C03_11915 [Pirellulaceae bacterium]